MDIWLVLGIIGMLCILAGFLLIQTHRLTPDSLHYDLLNAVGSILLIAYGYVGRAWPFVILNGVFAAYSLYDVLRDLQGPHTSKVRKG